MTTIHRNAHQQVVLGERSAQQLFDALCQPLFQSNKVNYFRYIRYYSDGRVLSLSSDVARDVSFMKTPENCLRLLESMPQYQEYFDFSSHLSLVALHQGSPWFFKRFILFFREQARDYFNRGLWRVSEGASAEITLLRILGAPSKLSDDFYMRFLEKTACKRYYLSGDYENVYMTPKELEVMVWVARGKYSTEIAVVMGVSVRTIEKHISAVKWKLSALRLTHAVRILVEQQLLDVGEGLVC